MTDIDIWYVTLKSLIVNFNVTYQMSVFTVIEINTWYQVSISFMKEGTPCTHDVQCLFFLPLATTLMYIAVTQHGKPVASGKLNKFYIDA